MQTYRISTTVTADNDDNDFLSHTCDEETYPHTLPMTPTDYARLGELINYDFDDDGRYGQMIFERFDTEFDRSTQESYPVIVTTIVERIA
jgi:hypothetical protein